MKRDLITLIADALEKEACDIQTSDNFREYEEWDSLAVLSMIAMITIPRKDFESVHTIEELANYIQEHAR
jgi:acyl carrier protein